MASGTILSTQFTKHLVDRYGIDEVAQWYFEVWNEPNLDFWAGDPKQETYFELYDHTARAHQAREPASARRRSGNRASGLGRTIIKHARQPRAARLCLHACLRQRQRQDVFGTDETIPRDQMVCRAVNKVHDQIKASPIPEYAADLERVQRQLQE